jgi:aryl-alcohol dehydrogenase-like predicted oxidoreductase
MNGQPISRRQLLKDAATAATVAAGAAALARVAAGALPATEPSGPHADLDKARKTASYNSQMEYRRLGKTGLWVSAVCLGGHWKGMQRVLKGPAPGLGSFVTGKDGEELLRNRHDVITRCVELGINYVDACTMGEVSAYGPALKGRREAMYMGFAMWPHCPRDRKNYSTAKAILGAMEEGMKAAQVDYVDVYRLVADERGSRHTQTEIDEMIAALDKARKDGKARFTGISSHDRNWLKMLIEKYPDQIQVVLFPYTADTKELPKDSIFEAVRKHNVGTFGIKPFGSASLFNAGKTQEEKDKLARMAIRYILHNPAMTAPIPGMASLAEVDNMALAIKERRQLDSAEKAQLDSACREMWASLPSDYQWLRQWRNV